MTRPLKNADADAGNDASFAATVVEELFVDADEGDSEPARRPRRDHAADACRRYRAVGRYELKHQLGSGGLGAVHAALDPLLSRQVAVKTLHVTGLSADAARVRSRRSCSPRRAPLPA